MLADLSYAIRAVFGRPLIAALAVVTIALGTGANTAVFSVVSAVLLRPLPYAQPERIVRLWEDSPQPGTDSYFTSMGMIRDWRAATSLEHVAEFWIVDVNLSDGAGPPDRVHAIGAGWSLSHVLGLAPYRGRFFIDDDYVNYSAQNAVLLGHGYWQQRYAARDDVLGRSIQIDGRPATIVGVLPPGATFENAQIWMNHNDGSTRHQPRYLNALGRLRPGATIEQARAELTLITERTAAAYPVSNRGWGVVLTSLTDDVVGSSRAPLLVLLAAVSLLLLITCANVANLLLAQAEARSREIAIRAALGATPRRLARQFLIEGSVFAVAGTVAGVCLAWAAIRLLRRLSAVNLPRLHEVELDWTMMLYALLLLGFTSVLFALAPMWRARRPDLQSPMHEAGRAASAGGAAVRVRHALVVAQMALAVVLVTAAGLLVHSLVRLTNTSPGFAAERVLTFNVALPQALYPTHAQTSAFYDRLLERLARMPGATAAGLTTTLPLGKELDYRLGFSIVGEPPAPSSDPRQAWYRMVSPAYFSAIDIRLRAGRFFTEADRPESAPVVIVNEAFVRRYIGGRDPIGLVVDGVTGNFGPLGRIIAARPAIVGVVGDVRYAGLDRQDEPAIFYAMRQAPFRNQTVVVRTAADPMVLSDTVRRVVTDIDPGLPVGSLETLEARVIRAAAAPRFRTWLIASFAVIALLLGGVGLYGVLSFMVVSRSREIGIRLALGGRPADIRTMVLGQSMRLAAMGAGVGLLAAFAASRALEGLLFEVRGRDPVTFALVPLVLLAVALAASWIPMRRAMRLDPATTLRE